MGERFTNPRFTGSGAAVYERTGGDESRAPGNIAFTSLTGSSATMTPAQMLDGVVRVSGGTTFTLTTPSAAALVAAALRERPSLAAGDAVRFAVQNTNSGTLTLTAGSGVTNSGTGTAATGVHRSWIVTFTTITSGAEAVTLTDG